MGMDGHGCHGHGQGRTGGKKMRERLVRLTGEKTKVQTRPLQTCTPHCHPIPGPGRDGSGASGMKQFVESSSIQGRLSGLSRGLADRILVWLTEREGCGRRVASTSTQRAADEDYCTQYQYRHADGKGALRIST
jgi:hypothetical protein